MTFRELREKSGMSLIQISKYFNVPYRSAQNWDAGSNSCPDYVMQLFEYRLKQDGLLSDGVIRFDYEREKAIRIKVVLPYDMNKYAGGFLAIYNNVKSDKDLWKVYNDYDNGVYVVCKSEVRDAAVRFLEQFGTVAKVEEIEVVRPLATNFEYPDDIDVEFLDVEE